jgi:hypothetical protein
MLLQVAVRDIGQLTDIERLGVTAARRERAGGYVLTKSVVRDELSGTPQMGVGGRVGG